MKKSILLWMCLALCLLAAGCSTPADSSGDGTEEAETNAEATEDIAAADDVPTLPPDTKLVDEIAPEDYQYTALSSSNGGLALEYPSHWTRIPGVSTICYIDPASDASVAARFTFTKKTLDNAPDSDKKTSQLASFLKYVVADYDSYEMSPLSTDGSFMGDNGAYYVTYTVQSEGVSLKGYVIMATKSKVLYVYHFRTSVTDYESFGAVMTRIRDSISLN